MIIACPACATRYAVPDSAIGIEGRTVRCAKCRHSWYQDGPETAQQRPASSMAPPVGAAPHRAENPTARPAPPPSPVKAPEAAPAPQPEPPSPPPPAVKPTPVEAQREEAHRTPVYGDEDVDFARAPSSFDHQPPFRPRRNPARMWTMAAVGFAVVALGGVGALAYYGDSGLMTYASGVAFGPAPNDLALDFPPTRQDRRTLPDGTQFFGVSGKVTNLGKDRHSVPNLLIILKDDHERVVYSWEVVPPKRVLAPGEAENIIEAVADIPRAAKFAEIGWKPT